jgi:hypothetical protein
MSSRMAPAGLAVAAGGFAVALLVYVAGIGGDVRAAAAARPEPPSLQGLQLPAMDVATVQRLERARARLGGLETPRGTGPIGLEFGMFGEMILPDVEVVVPDPEPEPEPVVVAEPPPPPPPPAPPFEYVVSMTYVSASSRFAVIDGHMYRVGARLPDEARVVGIEPNSVGIARADETRWIRVQDEVEVDLRMSVPEADPAPASPAGEAIADAARAASDTRSTPQ